MIRRRLLVAAILSSLMVVGGIALERRLGPRAAPAAPPASRASGTWICPHGGGEGWRVWLAVANAGADPAEVRLATASGRAEPQRVTDAVAPGTLRYFEVPAPAMETATSMEHFGEGVAASTIAITPGGALASAPCTDVGGEEWHVPEASTLRGEQSFVVVHNPFATDAVVQVSLTAGERVISPGRLKGVVLRPGETRAFDLHAFVLGEGAITARVRASLGRVAVEGITVSEATARATLAVPSLGTLWAIPGLGERTEILVQAPEGQDSPVSAEYHDDEGAVPALNLEAIRQGTAEVFGVELADAGLVVQADGDRLMLAGRRLYPVPPPAPPPEEEQGGKGGKNKKGDEGKKAEEEEPPPPAPTDVASSEGAPGPAPRWVVLPAVGPDGGEGVLLVQNPTGGEVEVRIRWLGPGGPAGESDPLTLGPASTVAVPLPPGGPAAAVVEATGEGVVAAQAASSPASFGVALGLPTD